LNWALKIIHMNNDNLDHYLKNEQVYSNELNIILAKTPSRIFHIMLWAIAALIIILSLSFYFVTYKEKLIVQALTKQIQGKYIISFLTDEKKANTASLQKNIYASFEIKNATSSGVNDIKIEPDSVLVTRIYQLNGAELKYIPDSALYFLSTNSTKTKYKVEYWVAADKLKQYLPDTGNVLTDLTINVTMKRLFTKFFK
jgi:hypothetical protein